jgi:hypothetical protein
MTDSTPELRPGVLVEHAKFGLGKVLDVQLANVLVHFRDDNQDTRKLAIVKSQLTWPESQSDPRLDCMPAFTDGKFEGRAKRVGLDDAIAAFHQKFPRGFEDPAYLESSERADKWTAHELYVSTLGDGAIEILLAEGQLAEIAQLVEKVVVPTKMLGKFEGIGLRDGLKDAASAPAFVDALLAFVAAPPEQARFEALVAALGQLPSKSGKSRVATWPVLTLLPFLAHPDRFMLLKPDTTVAGAARLRFDLQYDAGLRWATYERLMTLGEALLARLRPLGARDYIDVHAFLQVLEAHT